MKRRTYLDFDLQITPNSDDYTVRVLQSPAGQACVQVPRASLSTDKILPEQGSLGGPGPVEVAAEALSTAAGQALFRAVFRDDVLTCLEQSLVEARNSGCGLRIKLRMSEAPELIALPWEFLYHPSLDRFLALSAETPVVHYLDLPRNSPPLTVSLPLQILVAMSTPKDLPWLDSEEEWRVLQHALRSLIKAGAVTLERLNMVSLHDLQRTLRRGSYHVLHYIGHSTFDDESNEGTVIFCATSGAAVPVRARDLATVLGDTPSLRLVVLNGCNGSRSSPTDLFAGAAQALVQRGVPAVVAMNDMISNQAAIALTREFYAALADGQPVDAALAEARKAIATQMRSLEWAVPRLVMHAVTGQLWEIHAARSSKEDLLTVQAVDNSLSILAALIKRPDFSARLIALRTDFEAAASQIDLLTNYKDLHDLLHNLQYLCFNGLVQEAQRFPRDAMSYDIVLDYELSLGGFIDSLLEVASRPGMPSGELAWIQELAEAQNCLQGAIDLQDTQALQRAIWLMKRVLDRHPTRINERLNAAARALRLSTIEQGMLSIRRDLRRLKVAQEHMRRFEAGVAALGDLGTHLAQLVDDHDRWQAIDLELRRVEAALGHDVEEVASSWPELKTKVDPLCARSDAPWAEGIRRDARNLDIALASNNPTKIRRGFQRYRRRVSNRFYQVDTDLKTLCHELRYVGQPLAATFAILQ